MTVLFVQHLTCWTSLGRTFHCVSFNFVICELGRMMNICRWPRVVLNVNSLSFFFIITFLSNNASVYLTLKTPIPWQQAAACLLSSVCCLATKHQNPVTQQKHQCSTSGTGVWLERGQACSPLVLSEFVLQNSLWYYPRTSNSLFLPVRTWKVSLLHLSEGILLCLDSVSGRGPRHRVLMWNAMQGSQS